MWEEVTAEENRIFIAGTFLNLFYFLLFSCLLLFSSLHRSLDASCYSF